MGPGDPSPHSLVFALEKDLPASRLHVLYKFWDELVLREP